jgi:hypothetical protein
MTEAQFELFLAAFREQYQELRAIHDALGGCGLFPTLCTSSWASSPGWFGWPCEMSTSLIGRLGQALSGYPPLL